MWKQKGKCVMILAGTQRVSEPDKRPLHADSMWRSPIYYPSQLMCYYLWTTSMLGGDPGTKDVLNEKLINKTHFTAGA